MAIEQEPMDWVYHDGGRQAAGFKGDAGDCVTRAIAIAAEMQYRHVYDKLAELQNRNWRKGQHGWFTRPPKSARNGVYTNTKWFKTYMRSLGFSWHPCMTVGSGCQVHLDPNELPGGRLVTMLSRHACAVIDRVVYDTHDPSRGGTRCVYGYWRKDA